MAISRNKKEEILTDLNDKFLRSKSAVFIDISGVDVKTLGEIRKALKGEGMDLKVAKKNLLKIAIEKEGIEDVGASSLNGQVAVVFGYEDEIAPAKSINKFAREIENLKIVSGILERKFIDISGVKALAAIPSMDELMAQVVGSINAPVSGFVNALSGNIRRFIQALNAIVQK